MTVYNEIDNMREMGLIIQSTRELLEQTIKKKYPLHHCTHCSENLGRRPKKIKVLMLRLIPGQLYKMKTCTPL